MLEFCGLSSCGQVSTPKVIAFRCVCSYIHIIKGSNVTVCPFVVQESYLRNTYIMFEYRLCVYVHSYYYYKYTCIQTDRQTYDIHTCIPYIPYIQRRAGKRRCVRGSILRRRKDVPAVFPYLLRGGQYMYIHT